MTPTSYLSYAAGMRVLQKTRRSHGRKSPGQELLVSGLRTHVQGHKLDTDFYHVKLPDGMSIHTFRMSSAASPVRESIAKEAHSKPPIVLIHGFAAGMGMWFQLLPYLASTERDVYALDLPGSRSSKCTKATAYYTSALASWLEEVALQEVILIGHSFGAYISAQFARNHPARLSKLVLLSPVGLTKPTIAKLDKKDNTALADTMIGYMWCKWQVTPLALARGAGPGLLPLLIKTFVEKTDLFASVDRGTRNALWKYIYSLVKVKSSMEYLMPLCIHARGDAISEPLDLTQLPDIPGGIVIVRGGQDWATPLPASLSHSPKVTVLNLPKASHSMQIDNPKELFSMLRDHL